MAKVPPAPEMFKKRSATDEYYSREDWALFRRRGKIKPKTEIDSGASEDFKNDPLIRERRRRQKVKMA